MRTTLARRRRTPIDHARRRDGALGGGFQRCCNIDVQVQPGAGVVDGPSSGAYCCECSSSRAAFGQPAQAARLGHDRVRPLLHHHIYGLAGRQPGPDEVCARPKDPQHLPVGSDSQIHGGKGRRAHVEARGRVLVGYCTSSACQNTSSAWLYQTKNANSTLLVCFVANSVSGQRTPALATTLSP